MTSSLRHLYGIFYALAGFCLWVLADTAMKLAGEANLPSYEVVGFLGLIAAGSLVVVHAPQRKLKQLWPKRPAFQVVRALLAFGCVMSNTFALKHLPLTAFYVVVFTSPIFIAVLASFFLKERLSVPKIAATLVGFLGVVVAIDPWGNLNGGDWIGYAAAGSATVFYAIASVMLRARAEDETPQSTMFVTGAVEAVLGFGAMLWHAVPVAPFVLLILVVMGVMNVTGNLCNAMALREMEAATVEQYHYTQIIMGALLGYAIWRDVPTLYSLIGAVIIIVSGLYVAASAHKAALRVDSVQVVKQEA